MALARLLSTIGLGPRRQATAGVSPYPESVASVGALEESPAEAGDIWSSAPIGRRMLAAIPAVLVCVLTGVLTVVGGDRLDLPTLGLVASLSLLYLFAYLSPFESSVGSAVPTQPVLMALMLTAPLTSLLPAVLLAVIAAALIEGKRRLRSLLLETGNATPAIALTLMLWSTRDAQGVAHPQIVVLIGAVCAQLVLNVVCAYLLDRVYGTPFKEMSAPLLWSCMVDALLAVIGWGLTMAVGEQPLVLLLVIAAPILLVRILGEDRETYLQHALEMRDAYAAADAAAHRDAMTGAANRLGWKRALALAEKALADDPGHLSCTVLCADLDRLKVANDAYGHEVGDDLIKDMVSLLKDVSPSDATVARLGGDEFAVLVVAPVRRGPVDLVTPVRTALRMHQSSLPVSLSASLGQAHVRLGEPIGQAVLEADEAARDDKAARRVSRETATPDFQPGAPGARGQGSPNGVRVFIP